MYKVETERIKWMHGIEPEVFICMVCREKGKKARWRSLLVEGDLRVKVCHCGKCGRLSGKEMWLRIERG
jgi:hypothetical protein